MMRQNMKFGSTLLANVAIGNYIYGAVSIYGVSSDLRES